MIGFVSHIPQIVDRIVTEAESIADLGVDQVLDGAVIGEILDNFLVIGLTTSESRPGYESRISRQEGAGRARFVEEFTIRCLLSASAGDTDQATMRGLRHLCGDALQKLDEHLGDLDAEEWGRIGLTGGADWVPLQTSEGSIVNVMFEIEGAVLL